jgi:hypothetical protein
MSEANEQTNHTPAAVARAATGTERRRLSLQRLSLDSWAVLAALALAALVKLHILNTVKW